MKQLMCCLVIFVTGLAQAEWGVTTGAQLVRCDLKFIRPEVLEWSLPLPQGSDYQFTALGLPDISAYCRFDQPAGQAQYWMLQRYPAKAEERFLIRQYGNYQPFGDGGWEIIPSIDRWFVVRWGQTSIKGIPPTQNYPPPPPSNLLDWQIVFPEYEWGFIMVSTGDWSWVRDAVLAVAILGLLWLGLWHKVRLEDQL